MSAMLTPLMMLAGQTTGPSNSANRFRPPYEGSQLSDQASSVTTVRTPMPIDCAISNLETNFPVALTGAKTFTTTLEKNGADSALTAVTSVASTRASDVTHSVSFSAGDDFCIKFVPSGTPEAQTVVQVAALMTSVTAGESAIFGGTDATTISATKYAPFGSGRATAAEVDAQVICAAGGVIDRLYVHVSTAPTAGNSWVFTLYKNGVSTGLTCTVADAAVTANDVTHTVSIAAADRISVEMVAVGAPAAMQATFGCRWVPTIAGESLMFANWTTSPSANVDRWNNANGAAGNQSTETNTYNIVPYACAIKKMYLHVTTGPGGGTRTRSTWLRAGTVGGSQADQTLTAVLTDTATDANDTTHSYNASVGDLIDIRTNSSASATAPTQMTVGMVAYIAPAAAAAASGGTGLMMGIG